MYVKYILQLKYYNKCIYNKYFFVSSAGTKSTKLLCILITRAFTVIPS